MNELLSLALHAHGGLGRWNKITRLNADLSITGAIWHFKGKPDALKQITFAADTKHQSVTISPVTNDGLRSIFDLGHLSFIDSTGQLIERRERPRDSYIGHDAETQWDDFHVAYFSSYAVWGYLTSPFLYTYPGFVTEELTPWEENGEQWRRLKITFPENLASHCREQVSYFGPDGLLRRHDYNVEILGGATGANYAFEYQDFDGIKIPTQRRIYARDEQGQKIAEPLLVAIDVQRLRFS